MDGSELLAHHMANQFTAAFQYPPLPPSVRHIHHQ